MGLGFRVWGEGGGNRVRAKLVKTVRMRPKPELFTLVGEIPRRPKVLGLYRDNGKENPKIGGGGYPLKGL